MNPPLRALVLLCLPLLWAAAPAAGADSRLSAPALTPCGGAYSLSAVVRVSIRSDPGTVVVYTLDGTNPAWNRGIKAESNLVFFDLPPGDVVVRAAALKPGVGRGPVSEAKFTRSG